MLEERASREPGTGLAFPPRMTNRWSARVTRESHALALEPGVFTKESPRAIALSLKRSADQSTARKTDAFRSAMSMLSFYVNRAGKNLPSERRKTLAAAKEELRVLYGRRRVTASTARSRR
jgi:hypothetical protein